MAGHPWLLIPRTVRFGDTDAAGVMHFHQLLRWCHEAWEESLQRFGIPAAELFPGCGAAAGPPAVAVPLVHCSADFRRPLHCGDDLQISLSPRATGGGFEVAYELRRGAGPSGAEIVATALLRHRAIDAISRRPCPLPPALVRWLQASVDDPSPGYHAGS
jgi:1,4-dihydroxy-2-naphthoyl-CoA hydrolase